MLYKSYYYYHRVISPYYCITVLYRRIDQCNNIITMSSCSGVHNRWMPRYRLVSYHRETVAYVTYHCHVSQSLCHITVLISVIPPYRSMSHCRIDQCHMCHITVSISVILSYRSVSYRCIIASIAVRTRRGNRLRTNDRIKHSVCTLHV